MRSLLLITLLCNIMPAALLAQEPTSLRVMDERTARVGHTLALRNHALCQRDGRTGYWSGFLAASLAQYDRADRAAIAQQDGIEARPTITYLVPGGAAARAGFQRGDVIAAVNGTAFPTTLPDKASYAPQSQLEAATDKSEARYDVLRGGKPLSINLTFDSGCRSRLTVRDTARLNGRADGVYAEINAGIFKLVADDDELAFFIGHEMSHNILGHADWLDKVGRKTSHIRETEIAADRYSLRLMKGAGYDPDAAARFWRKVDKKFPFFILSDGTHMSDKARTRFLAQEAAALAAQ